MKLFRRKTSAPAPAEAWNKSLLALYDEANVQYAIKNRLLLAEFDRRNAEMAVKNELTLQRHRD